MDCFENIIGFTQTDCACFTPLLGNDYKLSTSGLYMDELPETEHILNAIKNIQDCEKKMVDIFSGARRKAIEEFKERLFMEVGTRFTVKHPPFNGLIGQTGSNGNVATIADWIGAAYEMKYLKGGTMKVNGIYLSLNTTGQYDVEIWKAYVINNEYQLQGNQPLQTYTLAAVANQATLNELETPLELPLADDSPYVIHYLALMNLPEGVIPRNNSASCGCALQKIIERWLIQGGIAGNDKNALRYASRQTGSTASINGIILDVSIACNDTGFICESYYGNPLIKKVIYNAVLFQAASNLISSVLRGESLNRFALTAREQMKADSKTLHDKFKSRVVWISENIDMKHNHCYVCNTVNESNGPYKTGIIL